MANDQRSSSASLDMNSSKSSDSWDFFCFRIKACGSESVSAGYNAKRIWKRNITLALTAAGQRLHF